MSIDSETLIKIKELSDKKDKTRRDMERLKDLKEFLEKNKEKNKRIPKLTPEEREKYGEKFLDKFKEKKKREEFKIPLNKDMDPGMGPMIPKGLTPEELKSLGMRRFKPAPGNLLKKGGEVKKYMGGGSVHKKKNTMATTKGWGISRKT